MDAESSPKLGTLQVGLGTAPGLRFSPMKRKGIHTAGESEKLEALRVLGRNLEHHLGNAYPSRPNAALDLDAATGDNGVSDTTIRRLIKYSAITEKDAKPHYPTLDALVALAAGLGIELYQLLLDGRQQALFERDREQSIALPEEATHPGMKSGRRR